MEQEPEAKRPKSTNPHGEKHADLVSHINNKCIYHCFISSKCASLTERFIFPGSLMTEEDSLQHWSESLQGGSTRSQLITAAGMTHQTTAKGHGSIIVPSRNSPFLIC